ncbi:MAG: hypothetical protein M0T76_07390 [Desulfobacteraceae bacterium]|nr:hypothetical protein [Desulfobacteraceae bacterium]
MRKTLLAALLAVSLAGCATATERQATTGTPVRKSAPVVAIHPLEADTYAHASVAILPFLVPEGVDPQLGRRVALLYQDILLGKAVFPTVRVLDSSYGDFREALAAGRLADTDLVLAGKINYAVEGTELGGARLDVTVRLLNVRTQATVWSISQAMDQPYSYPNGDLMRVLRDAALMPETRRSVGAPALPNMLMQSAEDMADVMAGSRYVRR